MTLGEILDRSAQRYPDKAAVRWRDQQMTFSELNGQANKLAKALNELGIGKESHIGILMPNRPEFLVSVFGIAKAGARGIPLRTSWHSREIVNVIDYSGMDAILTAPPYDDLVTEIRPHIPMIRQVITTREIPEDSRFLSFQAVLKPHTDANVTTTVKPDDLALLAYTAGATGPPKGAMLTHANILANIVSFGQAIKIQRKDVICTNLPLCSPFVMTTSVILPAFGGMTTILLEDVLPKPVLQAIAEHHVTVFLGLPPMYAALSNMARHEHEPVSHLRIGLCYGASIGDIVMKRFEESFPCRIFEGYGLSESSSFVSINTLAQFKHGSIGKPLDDRITWKIADEEGYELPRNIIGELLVSGPNVMKGYYKDEEATEEVFSDEWLRTGDMARMDANGFVSIVDRKADLIAIDDEIVYPAPIETLLKRHLDVQDAGVIGIDSPGAETPVKAYIVPVPGQMIDPEEILEFCREHRAKHEIPASIEIIEHIPRSMTGEIQRRELRAIAEGLGEYGEEGEDDAMMQNTAYTPDNMNFSVNFEDILRNLVTEAPGGVAGTLTGVDGVGISSYSMDPAFPTLVADAEMAAVMSASRGIAETLEAGNPKESCFIADRYGFITRQLGQYILTLVADTEEIDWGQIPQLFEKFAPIISRQLA